MEENDYYNPDFLDAKLLDSQIDILKITHNLGTHNLSDYIFRN